MFVAGSHREYLGVVGPESLGGQIPELTGLIQWLQVHLKALATNIAGFRRSGNIQEMICKCLLDVWACQ